MCGFRPPKRTFGTNVRFRPQKRTFGTNVGAPLPL